VWFNSFDINNWHGSLRKVKNVTMERAGEEISQIIVQQKKHAFFGNEIL
jgi:hypothetical protein